VPFQAVLESITDGAIVLDGKCRCTYVNDTAAAFLKTTPDKLIGRLIWGAFSLSRYSQLHAELTRAVEQKVPVKFEEHCRWCERWYDWRCYPADGGLAVFIEDVTERKQTEESLRESEQRYRKLFEANLVGVYLTTPDGTILDCNEAMMKMLGYDSREEIFQHHSSDFYADPKFRRELIRLLEKDGIVPGREARLRRKDGSVLHALGSAVLLTNEQTGEPYIQGVAVDISKRKEFERALRESEQRFRTVLENSLDIAYRRDLQKDRYDYISPVVEQILGFSPQEMTRLGLDDLLARIHPDDVERVKLGLSEAVSAGKGAIEYRFRCKDDRYRWLSDSLVVQKDEWDHPLYWGGMVRDITERKQAEEALQELAATLESKVAQRTAELEHQARRLQRLTLELSEAEMRERERLAEILHDDLQQQLAAVKFHLSILAGRIQNDAESREMTLQIKQMVADAIRKSRDLSHELSPPALSYSDLYDAFEWLAQQMRTKHGLTVHLDACERIDTLSESLKALLYRVGQELLFNVIKHARVGEAKLRLRRRRGRVHLIVADDGRGFDPQELARTNGFGLLAIHERIKSLGGRMKIMSLRGKGSVVAVTVPEA
jgi:PAS domain S-box-containing protein